MREQSVTAVPELALRRELRVKFKDPRLLRLALTHRSYVHEQQEEGPETNERLEFLGDALLGLVIAQELYRRFPDADEGQLTSWRSALVRTESLAGMARQLRLGDYLHLGRGEEQSGGRDRDRNLARALEAIAGAVLEDQGLSAARRWTLCLFAPALDALGDASHKDYKSVLQEMTQAEGKGSPVYRTVSSMGPDHRKEFTVEVLVADAVVGRGHGLSKRMAQRDAARHALAQPRVLEAAPAR